MCEELRRGLRLVPLEQGHSNGVPNDVRVPLDEHLDGALETRRHRHVFFYGIYNAFHSKLAPGATIVARECMTVISRQNKRSIL